MKQSRKNGKNFFFWVLIIVAVTLSYNFFKNLGEIRGQSIPFSDFLEKVDAGQVADVAINNSNINGHLKDGAGFKTLAPNYPDLISDLRDKHVRIEVVEEDVNWIVTLLFSFGPVVLLIGAYIFVWKQMQSGGSSAMSFGKSRARLMTEKQEKVTFKDVAGIEEAQEELEEIVEFLKDPGKFQKLGGKIPKGCLLIGPPGTGKTLLARAIAGEANVPFFSISGSDFVEMFVGVGASRVRNMFEQGKKHAPCIIFIDEIDAVGRNRGSGLGNSNDEREQTLNQLLVEMDGFEANEGIIIIAATNRPDVLDPALLRPGRFDRQITVSNPDIEGRKKIIEVHLRKIAFGPDVNAEIIARGTPGFSGADLANLVNEAALLAARKNKKVVTMHDLEDAKDKVLLGVERKSMVMSEEEKKLTAYHEAGHAVLAIYCIGSDPIHKATIIPRGRALGLVMRLPEKDRVSLTREKLKADICVAMGGRVAEEMIFGYEKVTSGASMDIKQATAYATAMVKEWGMSDKVGPLYHGEDHSRPFTMPEMQAQDTVSLIDQEIKSLVIQGYDQAKQLLNHHLDKLHLLAKALLEFETLSGDEIRDLMDGKPILRKKIDDGSGDIESEGFTRRSSVPSSSPKPANDKDAPANPANHNPDSHQDDGSLEV
ncbi:MAG: ATP-dependent zinc metalloprotease FtsH [Alphaproteobacteria bacterium]|nr:ATP-dependent zinc metalloprotease FtsH [Alphaproteobacteria bacterium]